MTADAHVSTFAEMERALKFYANPEVYKPHPHGLAFDDRDLSYVARAALSKVEASPAVTEAMVKRALDAAEYCRNDATAKWMRAALEAALS